MDAFSIKAMGVVATAFIVCVGLGPVLIPLLHKLKFGQSIRDCGPAAHIKKSGTPTMGGLMMLAALIVAMLVWVKFSPAIIIALVLTVGHALIGSPVPVVKTPTEKSLSVTHFT